MTNETCTRQSAKGDQSAPTRRSFLTRVAGVSALAVPTLTLMTSRKAQAQGSGILTGFNAELINEILDDEAAHVPIIQNLLDDPDNPLDPPIRQAPNFNMERLTQRNLQTFLETASVFENTGSGLYHGALLNIQQTQEYFPTAAGLAAVESRHASWLNSLLRQALVPDFAPVEAEITQGITLARVAEFVTDPRSTFPSFDTTVVSSDNNFAILDFILFLEYIESTFYAINVPLFT
jgi:hypothetical protein